MEDNKTTPPTREFERIDKFVNVAPTREYTIDQKSQTLCRQSENGQKECIKVNLEYSQMFTQMQKLGFFCTLPMDPTETYMECRRV
ncbi:hypothetical protein BDB01DRAFT_728119 [Pilobolus umbonatus]|nr:hypothetical protein BDB01DRAFT_728119 [Pilobolus umbonatus]